MPNQSTTLIRRFAKLCFWASLCLGCVAAIEAGQDRVSAINLQTPTPSESDRSEPSQIAPPVIPGLELPGSAERKTDPLKRDPDNRPSSNPPSSSSVTHSGSSSQTTEATKPQHAKLAINTGVSAQKVAEITPNQVAATTWTGASFPVENFQAYTSPFGYRSSPTGGYSQEFHYGLDMAAPEGSYIRNWWSGKVVEVSDDSNCGTSVVVESGSWLHIYCHMQGHVETENGKRYMIDRSGGIQIWENQAIVAGSRIGRVGMTGRTTGPHLHWGLKYDENWVDPALVLRAMYLNQAQTIGNRTEAVQ